MRRSSVFLQRDSKTTSTMTPMIDVVFLLLVFFIWTASFQLAEYPLPSELSSSIGTTEQPTDLPPPPESDFDEIVIRLTWDGELTAWAVNDVPMLDYREVRDRLRTIAEIRRDAPVIVHPDPDVPLGTVIDAYDAARTAGFDEVQYAVEEPQS